MSKRTLKVQYHRMTVETTWSNPTITAEEFHNGRVIKAATIVIRNPDDLRDFRRKLDEIEAHWRRQLGPA